MSITKKAPLAILDATFIGTPREVYSEATEERPERELIGWDANVSELDCAMPATVENAREAFGVLARDQPDETVDFDEVDRAFERALPPPQPEPEVVYSKLKIYQAAASSGMWAAIEQLLKATTAGGVNMYEAWLLAQDISNKYPGFAELKAEVARATGQPVEIIDSILSRCIADGDKTSA